MTISIQIEVDKVSNINWQVIQDQIEQNSGDEGYCLSPLYYEGQDLNGHFSVNMD